MVMCLDLAAINVHSDAPMGQGGFPALLSHIITCMATQGIRCLFVECVLNKGFEEHLVNKHGFLPMPTNTPEDVCLYKII